MQNQVSPSIMGTIIIRNSNLEKYLTLPHYFINRCDFHATVKTNGHRNDIIHINPSQPVHLSCIKTKISVTEFFIFLIYFFFFSTLFFGTSGFMKVFKSFIKPFEAPRRIQKIKI